MEDKDKLKKRMMFNYLISQLFADRIDNLETKLQEAQHHKNNDDIFIEKKPEPVKQEGPKVGRLKLSDFDGQRFTAIKNKALKRMQEESTPQPEQPNGEVTNA